MSQVVKLQHLSYPLDVEDSSDVELNISIDDNIEYMIK